MDWIEYMNRALAYIEANLDGEIDYAKAAEIACCSSYHFQRVFAYIAGAPLSEYIRRRRMTRAAQDLLGGEKVLDVALKYGYNSPTAFNRAFQTVHGIPPSEARRAGVMLKSFQPISFKITVKGVVELEYRIEQRPAFRIIGISAPIGSQIEENFSVVPGLWQRAAQENVVGQLAQRMDGEPKGILGVSACYGDEMRYWIAAASRSERPDGMEETVVPAATWAVFPGRGTMPDSVQELERRIVTEWLPTSGYEYAEGPDIEVYLTPDPQNALFEVWIPVVRKKP